MLNPPRSSRRANANIKESRNFPRGKFRLFLYAFPKMVAL